MAVTSIEASVHKTYEWLHEFKDFGNFRDESTGYSVFRTVIHALRDELPEEVTAEFASQLPLILKGVYFDGWDPHHQMNKPHSLDEFIAPIEKNLAAINVNSKEAVRDCFKFIQQKLDPHLADKVMLSLSAKLRQELS